MSASVGVRELRQNLSRYLDRVRAGERLIVTERNRPVAELIPLSGDESAVARLVAEGRVIAPIAPGPIEFAPIKIPGAPRAGTEALDFVRGERG